MTALVSFSDKQLALIRKTVAKDCNADEFDWFISICRQLRLDPLRRQIYAFVYHKNDDDRRQMVPIVAIAGYRSIAERTGNYRPGPAQVETDDALKDHDGNPSGIVSASVTVFKFSHGDWHAVTETAYWEEFAPIRLEPDGGYEWQDTGEVYPVGHKKAGKPINRRIPIGKMRPKLDAGKDNWRKMPRVMLEKCAEAKALRRAWPDDFAGTYVEGEMDRAEVLDLTPTEMADSADQTKRLALIGGPALTVDWMDGKELQRVPVGQFGDKALDFINAHTKPGKEEIGTVLAWKDRNNHALKEYWAHDKDGALQLKAALEKLPAMAAE